MNDQEHKKAVKDIREYLINQCGSKISDKIMEKVAKKLGLSSYLALVKLEFPGKKLADFTVGMLKYMYFEGYYSTYSNSRWNPYNPKEDDQQDQFVEYLLYSWARGNPGYKYWYSGI